MFVAIADSACSLGLADKLIDRPIIVDLATNLGTNATEESIMAAMRKNLLTKFMASIFPS